ncbi:AMIN domain-containing protein [Arcobacter sp. YIC-310]|uniref:AMIN domain-containing protein n=1 Tax=Arcobacter sp. YIC-310 TaxID=3376632 RepID=UPI003C1C38C0
MKTISLFTSALILAVSLEARENPFDTTAAYEEEAARIIELNEESLYNPSEEDYAQRMQEKLAVEGENKNIVEKQVNIIAPEKKEMPKKETKYSKDEVEKLIKKAQKQTEYKTKKLIEKKLEQTKVIEPKQVVFVKPRADVEAVEETFKEIKILPFLKLQYSDEELNIHTDYKVSKKFSIKKENKLIIDYKANVNFYTKREDLNSKNFKKVAVGNHKKDGFFRVVIELNKAPSSYKVDYKNNLITIFNSDEMR